MKREVFCPQCNAKVSSDYEKAIVPNKQFENQLDIYKKMRDSLRANLVRLSVLENEKKRNGTGMGKGKKSDTKPKGSKRGRPKKNVSSGDDPENLSPKRSRRLTAKNRNYASSNEESESDEDDDDYNDNLFLGKNESTSNDSSNYSYKSAHEKLHQKTKVNYHKMKKKTLQELCRKEGLSTQGSEKELQKRHEDFILLYNSECDSEHPRSVQELLNEVKNREMALKVRSSFFNDYICCYFCPSFFSLILFFILSFEDGTYTLLSEWV